MKTAATRPIRRKQFERSAESAQRLLDATISLIAEKGFEKATAAEIGQRAGYSREMVRHRYGSKEQLLESLLDIEIKERLLKPGLRKQSGLEEALVPVKLMRQLAKENPELLRTFFILCFEAVGPIPSLAEWMRKWLAEYQLVLSSCLKKGQADGSVRENLDIADEVRTAMYFGSGLGYYWMLDPNVVNFDRALKKWSEQLRGDWSSE